MERDNGDTDTGFCLLRKGLKPNHHIPGRLRFVDFFGSASGVLLRVLLGFGSIKLLDLLAPSLPAAILQNPTIFILTVMIPMMLAWYFLTGYLWGRFLRVVFRITGLLRREEALHFPLPFGEEHSAPWPDSWQHRDEQVS